MSLRYEITLIDSQPVNTTGKIETTKASVGQPKKINIKLLGILQRSEISSLWATTKKYFDKHTKESEKILAWEIDCEGLKEIDSFGVAYFLECERLAKKRSLPFSISHLTTVVQEKITYYKTRKKESLDVQSYSSTTLSALIEIPTGLGRFFYHWSAHVLARISFLGEVIQSIGYVLRHPRFFRKQDFLAVMQQMGVTGLFIILIIGMMVGVVLSFQTMVALRNFGSDVFVVNAVSIAIFRGFGPFVTAVIVAGRTGSSFAAELGAMKKNEEIYALKTMGINPTVFLVIPRLLAMTIVTPLLNIFFVASSMVGTALVVVSSGMPVSIFLIQLQEAIGLSSVLITMIKPIFFGTLIAFVGCYRGLYSASDSRAIGKATTASMVDSLIGIIFLDGIYSVFIYVFEL